MNNTPEEINAEAFDGSATYCPEDNKLRLYVGRVPRDEYLKLRAEGWVALHKQREVGGGDFAAVWTPERRDTALEYAGIIEDEDMGPAERAADRAERFAMYREKRTAEAVGKADRFDAGPAAHGYQSQARAERAARRHDAIAGRAVDSWSKAEYWQSRTAGVISHALHKAAPGVRMGRIKELEADLRRIVASYEKALELFRAWEIVRDIADPEKQTRAAIVLAGGISSGYDYKHPDDPTRTNSLYGHMTCELKWRKITGAEAVALYFASHSLPDIERSDWANHYKLRLAYENQMLEAQGGRAAFVEMEAGGWIGERQIRKVNKSNASGRVVSVEVMGKSRGFSKASGYTQEETRAMPVLLNVERLPADAYRAPTEADKAALAATLKAEKDAAPQKEPCPLVNPTDADAEKLQEMLNAGERSRYSTPQKPVKMTFAQYTGRGCVKIICEDGTEHRTRYGSNLTRCDVFKVRTIYGDNYSARRVVILTDKPQKGIPWAALAKAKAAQPSVAKLTPRMAELSTLMADCGGGGRSRTKEEHALLCDAEYVGWVSLQTCFPSWTDAGTKAREQYRSAGPKAAVLNAGESLA